MKSVAAAICMCLAGSTSAFKPASSQLKSVVSLMMSDSPVEAENPVFKDLEGSRDYRGGKFEFDPMGLSKTYSPWVPWFRECELRHGRTAMLAVVGFIATDFIRIPGDMYSFEAIPKTIDIHDALLKNGPMYQLLLWIGLWDILITGPSVAALDEGREPGDFGWLFFAPKDPKALSEKRESELLNGRLAMVALGGIATQSVISGHGFPYV
eukprot:CAMPEP_0194376252 /NCGR_PEP_ID=MMETSP0174-20130528/24685_1 /TAXON_ID=216777 /ORGANISM="Proboscia alata, Strain PI-D3" /LENGTH=209 /DNA_ID=CAMNT_0039156831 /DNA_START=126 /DNA_END=755 /DNA_ORIENTATION=-